MDADTTLYLTLLSMGSFWPAEGGGAGQLCGLKIGGEDYWAKIILT